MKNEIHRIGIVGAGYIGRVHLSTFKNLPNVQVIGITDLNQDASQKLAQEFSCESFHSLPDLLQAGPDAIVVCTPPSQRLEIFHQAREANVSILAEKPLAIDSTMGEEIKALADQSDLIMAVGYCHRFVPFVQKVKTLQRESTYGQLLSLSQNFIVGAGGKRLKDNWMSDPSLSGGGVLMDTMCHSIDLAQFIAGQFIESDLKTRHTWPGRGETAALVQAKTDRDVLVHLSGSWEYPVPHFDLRIIFERAELFYNYSEPIFYTLHEEGAPSAVKVPVETHNDRFGIQAGAFIDELNGRHTCICKINEALAVSQIVDSLYQATPQPA